MIVFEPLTRDRLYQGIVDQITRSILTGQMGPGDQIPTESDLAEQFGVSRTVVREAIKALGSQGLIISVPGRGSFITQPSMDLTIRNIKMLLTLKDHSLDDLLFVRRLLEVPTARLAAQNAGPANLDALRKCMEQVHDYLDDAEAYVQLGAVFHKEIARASGNIVLSVLVQAVFEMMQSAREMVLRVPEAARRALAHHEELYQAIAAKDPIAAETCMREHLAQVAKDIDLARRFESAVDGA